MIRYARLLLLAVVSTIACHAMEAPRIMWQDLTPFYQQDLRDAFDELREIFTISFARGEHAVEGMRADLVRHLHCAMISKYEWQFSRLRPAEEALQEVWRDAQTCAGIAQTDQKLLLINDHENSDPFTVANKRVLVNPVLEKRETAWYTWRAGLVHEATHVKGVNFDRVCAECFITLLPASDVWLSYLVATLDVDALPACVDKEAVRAIVERYNLPVFDANVRVDLLGAFLAKGFKAHWQTLEVIQRANEAETDQLMLEKIDCAECLRELAHMIMIKTRGDDDWRVENGYASLVQIEARAHELEGKCCRWHAK